MSLTLSLYGHNILQFNLSYTTYELMNMLTIIIKELHFICEIFAHEDDPTYRKSLIYFSISDLFLSYSFKTTTYLKFCNPFSKQKRFLHLLLLYRSITNTFLDLYRCYIIATKVAGLATSSSDYNVCHTAACREFGKIFQNNMNNSVDPCIDFYEYGCGSWAINNPIPPNQLEISADYIILNKINHRIKELLEEESEFDKLAPIKLAKQYYQSCMDEDAIENQDLKPILSLLNETGGWPILMSRQEWKSKNYTWQEIDNNYIQMLGGSSFFDIGIIIDPQNSTRQILAISLDTQSDDDDKAADESEQNEFAFIEAMSKIIMIFVKNNGIKISPKKLQLYITELVLFKIKLQNITEPERETHILGKNETRMTIAELQEYYDLAETNQSTAKIDWLRTIRSLFKPVHMNINASEPVIVYDKHILHRLARLLDTTSPRVLVNYIQWNMIDGFIPYLNKKLRDIQFKSQYSIYNVTEQDPRWKTCVENTPMKDAISYLFIKKYTTADTLKNVSEMVEDIKKEMKMRISHSTWTNNNTKKFMLDKMDNIISQIGYPEWYNNQTAFIERYKGLEIGENYFENAVAILKYEIKRILTNFREPGDRSKWTEYPVTVNAFYLETTNAMVIPAAEVQDPYFTTGIPFAINYAVVGSTIGHELAHSFDTTGIKFDKFGNKLPWHSEETTKAYGERAQCFVNQYNNFTLDVTNDDDEPIQIDGELTKDENIADSVGIEIAFAAFQQRKSMMGPQPKLPGLSNISDEQLFFLAYVNAWCTSSRMAFEEDYVNTDVHSPAKFRIIGSLSNMKSFSKAFNCAVDSPMNPTSRCSLWK